MKLFRRLACPFFFLCILFVSSFFLDADQSGRADSGAADFVDIVIFYTSDTHGAIVSNENTIGLDRVAAIKRGVPGALLVDAGDFLHGKPLATLTQGKDVVRLMKKVGYFAVAAGNHEFSYLPDVLKNRRHEAESPPDVMPILSANVQKMDGTLLFQPEATAEVAGVAVCLFGLTTRATKQQARPSSTAGLSFADPTVTARDVSMAQRARGCQVILALTHIGSDPNFPDNSRELATRVPGIDIIIDGHSHVVLQENTGVNRMLVSPGAHGRLLGRLDIRYDKNRKKISSVTNTFMDARSAAAYPPDPELAKELVTMQAALDERLSLVVGNLRSELPGKNEAARSRETALGNLCADALRAAYGDDIALVNGGALRDGIRKGEVTRGEILSAIPFNDLVISVTVTGAELLEILEYGFSHLPGKSGAFPQISGLVVHVKTENPPGRRILSAVLADGSPVNPEQAYTLSTNAFLADGGDGYPHLANKPRRKSFAFADETVIRFIRNNDTSGYVDGKPSRIFLQ